MMHSPAIINTLIFLHNYWCALRALVIRASVFTIRSLIGYITWATHGRISSPRSNVLFAYATVDMPGEQTMQIDVTLLVYIFYFLRPPARYWLAKWLAETGIEPRSVTILRGKYSGLRECYLSEISMNEDRELITGKSLLFGDVSLDDLPSVSVSNYFADDFGTADPTESGTTTKSESTTNEDMLAMLADLGDM